MKNIDKEMEDSIRRYDQAKEDGTLDEKFPVFGTLINLMKEFETLFDELWESNSLSVSEVEREVLLRPLMKFISKNYVDKKVVEEEKRISHECGMRFMKLKIEEEIEKHILKWDNNFSASRKEAFEDLKQSLLNK